MGITGSISIQVSYCISRLIMTSHCIMHSWLSVLFVGLKPVML